MQSHFRACIRELDVVESWAGNAGRGKMQDIDHTSHNSRERAIQRVDARELLGPRGEVRIIHKDTEYRLRLTSNDKLILTK